MDRWSFQLENPTNLAAVLLVSLLALSRTTTLNLRSWSVFVNQGHNWRHRGWVSTPTDTWGGLTFSLSFGGSKTTVVNLCQDYFHIFFIWVIYMNFSNLVVCTTDLLLGNKQSDSDNLICEIQTLFHRFFRIIFWCYALGNIWCPYLFPASYQVDTGRKEEFG